MSPNNKKKLIVLRKKLDLLNQEKTEKFFKKVKPDFVIIAAAKVGGIFANSQYPADFIFENLQIQNNIISSCIKYKTIITHKMT